MRVFRARSSRAESWRPSTSIRRRTMSFEPGEHLRVLGRRGCCLITFLNEHANLGAGLRIGGAHLLWMGAQRGYAGGFDREGTQLRLLRVTRVEVLVAKVKIRFDIECLQRRGSRPFSLPRCRQVGLLARVDLDEAAGSRPFSLPRCRQDVLEGVLGEEELSSRPFSLPRCRQALSTRSRTSRRATGSSCSPCLDADRR